MNLTFITDNSGLLEEWQRYFIDACMDKGLFTIVGFICVNKTANDSVSDSKPTKISLSRSLIDSYIDFDRKFFGSNRNATDRSPTDPEKYASLKKIVLENGSVGFTDNEKLEEFVKANDIDVAINFLRPGDCTGIGRHFKIGLIDFSFTDRLFEPDLPLGFLEVVTKRGETDVEVRLDHRSGKSFSLYRGSSITNFKSVIRTSNVYFWKVPGILSRVLQRIDQYDFDKDDHGLKTSDPEGKESKGPKVISPWGILQWLSILMTRILSTTFVKRIYFDQWILLYTQQDMGNDKTRFGAFERMVPPKDRFWADPFVLRRDNRNFIFLEELLYTEQKGFISVMEIDEKGNYQLPEKVLEEDYHLSYPFLFEDNGELYMIPETYENRTIQIYRCTEFPKQWKLEKVLMKDVMAVDSTIIFHEDTYWMFTNIASHEATSTYDELYLFYSDSLLSDDWIAHPENPIVTDVKNARPAGNLFRKEGKWYRPSQNCSIHYGYGMQINEVLELNKYRYREKTIESINPDWADDLVATHTLNSAGGLTVIDALVRRRGSI